MEMNHYFSEQGEYTHSVEAYPGTLPPDNAIRVNPAISEGKWPVLNAKRTDWKLVADHRGQQGFVDGTETIIEELGPLPDGWSEFPPEKELEPTQVRIGDIDDELLANDLASIRAIRAKELGEDTDNDRERLREHQEKASRLREERAALLQGATDHE